MSGHSQFKNIMHRKGAQDKVRARTFSKLAREITVAAIPGPPVMTSTPSCAARSVAQSAPACGDYGGARGKHAEGQY